MPNPQPCTCSKTSQVNRCRPLRLIMRLSVAVLAVAALVGCSQTSAPVASGSAPVSSASPAGSSAGFSTSAPVVWADGTTGEPPTAGRLGLDESSRSAALELAGEAMVRYARPDMHFEVWWADLMPLLSAQGAAAYATVDPANIPVRAVTGPSTLPEWTTPEVARVSVPTDVGAYLVIVSRTDLDPVWRVERFAAPEVLS